MQARTLYGALGAAAYNVVPLVSNTVEVLFARPVRDVYRYADERGWIEELNAANDQLIFVGVPNAADIGPALASARGSFGYARAWLGAGRAAGWLRNTAASSRLLRWLRVGRRARGAARGATDEMTTVSRWGREGLEPGDFVMKGGATKANYIKSGKWQPGMGNQPAPFRAGQEFTVPKTTLHPPSHAATAGFFDKGVFGWVKMLLGQRSYKP